MAVILLIFFGLILFLGIVGVVIHAFFHLIGSVIYLGLLIALIVYIWVKSKG